MKVITPGAVARHTGSKYLGVLVAAKLARSLNEFRSQEEPADTSEQREKLTTIALGEVATGRVNFELVKRRRPEA